MAISEQLENETKGMELLLQSADQGRPIPGQSLVNDPEQSYKWEQPPQIVTLQDGIIDIFKTLIIPDVFQNLVGALRKGVAVSDIGSAILYSGFLEGKWSPDLMVLLAEPVMYVVMAMGERAGVEDMRIYAGEELDEDDLDREASIANLNQVSSYAALQADKKPPKQVVPSEVLEKLETLNVESLLDKPMQNTKSNESLLGR